MKDREKCKKCRFCLNRKQTSTVLMHACNFAEMMGRCRIVIEMQNGTYKSKDCCVFEPIPPKKKKSGGKGIQLKGSTPRKKKGEQET